MLNFIDNFLNSITMYRLLFYYLILLLLVATIFSIFGVFPFGPVPILVSAGISLITCYAVNKIFALLFKVQLNAESMYITAFILALIVQPGNYLITIFVAFAAMASKYIFNIRGKHIFNPTAAGVVIAALLFNQYATWWVGTTYMFPFLLLGLLIVRKLRRFSLVLSFLGVSLVMFLVNSFSSGFTNIFSIINGAYINSPILFFAFVMVTEPLTTPPTRKLQMVYGGLIGFLNGIQLHFGPIFMVPEVALVTANIFSYIVSPKQKLSLVLKEKIKEAGDVYDFVFTSSEKLKFKAGQYLEWTLGQSHPDARGNRRYFTVSSSPTENDVKIGIKIPENASSFKLEMMNMKVGSKIVGANLSGDFVMPVDASKKLCFIAGGIGITPFRSMIKYLTDTNDKRDIVLIYSEKNKSEMVYKDIFDVAAKKLGVKIIYFETDVSGHMVGETLMKDVPDYRDRIFYLSGSHGMVVGFEKTLSDMKVPKAQVMVDYFPGY